MPPRRDHSVALKFLPKNLSWVAEVELDRGTTQVSHSAIRSCVGVIDSDACVAPVTHIIGVVIDNRF